MTNTPPLSNPTQALELIERVSAVIYQRMSSTAGRLRVTERDGRIVLEGEVPRFYDRQLALECARHVPGVRNIVDRITVSAKRDE